MAMNDSRRLAGVAEVRPMVRVEAAPVPEAQRPAIAEEQLAYARLLDTGMKVGLLVLTGTFAVYLLGVVKPHVPVEDLPRYWSLPVKAHLAAIGVHAGWGWTSLLGRGDYLNFVGIVLLSAITVFCYLAVLPIFLRRRERVYAGLAVLEVLVLALAASGLLATGGH